MALRTVAAACCDSRIVAITEGGYDLEALGASLDAVVQTLATALGFALGSHSRHR